jgi:PAS domain S-box-containing protein
VLPGFALLAADEAKLFENLQPAIHLCPGHRRVDGRFKRVNPAFERTLGYPLRELVSRPFLEVIHPDDGPWLGSMFAEFVRGDRDDMIGVEHRVVCSDGSVRWLQSNSRVVHERGVVFAVARDVTDQQRADAALREAHRMVEASRDELARLAEEQAALRRVATLVARGEWRRRRYLAQSRRRSSACFSSTRAPSAENERRPGECRGGVVTQ